MFHLTPVCSHVLLPLSETKLSKRSQTLQPFLALEVLRAPASAVIVVREREKQNKTQLAATSGISRSFHHNLAGTRLSPQAGRRPRDPSSSLTSLTNLNVLFFGPNEPTTVVQSSVCDAG